MQYEYYFNLKAFRHPEGCLKGACSLSANNPGPCPCCEYIITFEALNLSKSFYQAKSKNIVRMFI